jgi:hypothetical protein
VSTYLIFGIFFGFVYKENKNQINQVEGERDDLKQKCKQLEGVNNQLEARLSKSNNSVEDRESTIDDRESTIVTALSRMNKDKVIDLAKKLGAGADKVLMLEPRLKPLKRAKMVVENCDLSLDDIEDALGLKTPNRTPKKTSPQEQTRLGDRGGWGGSNPDENDDVLAGFESEFEEEERTAQSSGSNHLAHQRPQQYQQAMNPRQQLYSQPRQQYSQQQQHQQHPQQQHPQQQHPQQQHPQQQHPQQQHPQQQHPQQQHPQQHQRLGFGGPQLLQPFGGFGLASQGNASQVQNGLPRPLPVRPFNALAQASQNGASQVQGDVPQAHSVGQGSASFGRVSTHLTEDGQTAKFRRVNPTAFAFNSMDAD